MNDVMVDIETLGTAPGSVVVSIGAVYFDDDGLGVEFYRVIDVLDSLFAGLRIDEDTLAWWQKQSASARAALRAEDARRPLDDALQEFARFLDAPMDSVRLWAKGPDFDLVLLQSAYHAVNQRLPWKYRNARDVRTILALSHASLVVPPPQTHHHALNDACYQAEQVRAVYAALGLSLASSRPLAESDGAPA